MGQGLLWLVFLPAWQLTLLLWTRGKDETLWEKHMAKESCSSHGKQRDRKQRQDHG